MTDHPRSPAAIHLAIAVAVAAIHSGCSPTWLGRGGGKLQVTSNVGERTSLRSSFKTGLYRLDTPSQVTILLIDGPLESPAQAVTIRMLWQPRAGRTPVQETATNATVHYVIFAGESGSQVGIYSGAGYFYPRDTPGDLRMHANLWQATLKLDVSTDAFRDLLGSAILEGSLTVRRDDVGTSRTLRAIQQRVHSTLGYPRQVMGETAPAWPQGAKLVLARPSG